VKPTCRTCGKPLTQRKENGVTLTFPCSDEVAHRSAETAALLARTEPPKRCVHNWRYIPFSLNNPIQECSH